MTIRLVDLTFPIHEGMTTYPAHWHPVVEVTLLGRHGIEGRETRRVVLGTHTGTHCDAPRHFVPGGNTVEALPLEALVGDATLLDLSGKACPAGGYTVDDLDAGLAGGRPERLVLRYDWSDKWGTFGYYEGYPFLSEPAARWLVGRGLRLLGMDTPTPDDPAHGWRKAKDSPVHKILLEAGVVLVEYLCNLRRIGAGDFELIALPLPILGGDGAPCRVLARVRDPETSS